MIEKVILMNLKHREDKWLFAAGTFRGLNFPMHGGANQFGDVVERFIAHDGLNYKDGYAVRTAAIADGFPYFDKMLWDDALPQEIAWCWTWASALRSIIDRDIVAILLIDDFMPTPPLWTWDRLNGLVELVNVGFRAMQLDAKGAPDSRMPPVEYYDSIIGKGFLVGNERATILTPEGAKLLLEVNSEPPYGLPQDDFAVIAKRGLTDAKYKDGLYHVSIDIIQVNLFKWGSDLARFDAPW